jgi:hypothetical protein
MRKILFLLSAVLFHSSPSWSIDWMDAAKKVTQPSPTTTSTIATKAVTDNLTGILTSGLNVSNEQASGGLGSLFSLAQNSLGENDFSSLSSYIPNMSSYLDALPGMSSESSSASGLLNSLGGLGESAAAANTVAGQFSALGLSAEQIPQYIQIINDYLQSSGGQQAVDLFQSGISSLL